MLATAYQTGTITTPSIAGEAKAHGNKGTCPRSNAMLQLQTQPLSTTSGCPPSPPSCVSMTCPWAKAIRQSQIGCRRQPGRTGAFSSGCSGLAIGAKPLVEGPRTPLPLRKMELTTCPVLPSCEQRERIPPRRPPGCQPEPRGYDPQLP